MKVIIKYISNYSCWAIVSLDNPNFWMFTFSTISEAKAHCAKNSWEVIKVYKK